GPAFTTTTRLSKKRRSSISKSEGCRWNWTGFKKSPGSYDAEPEKGSIEANHRRLSIARQCELIALPRSSWYYKLQEETAENLLLMRLLDEQYTSTPFYGSRRMVIALGEQGWKVNRKRVQRLMPQMGIEAIYPKPRLSDPAPGHRIYPYRLRGMVI